MSHPLLPLLQIRTFYLTDGITHRKNEWIHPVDPDIPPGHSLSGIEIYLADGTTSTWMDEDGAYFDMVQGLLSDDTTLIRSEIWKYATDSSDGVFIRADALGGTGDVAAVPVLSSEVILTGRTSTGRIMRVTFEESVWEPAITETWVVSAFPLGLTLAYYLADECPVCDREGGRMLAGMHVNKGQSEAIFKKRNRPNN